MTHSTPAQLMHRTLLAGLPREVADELAAACRIRELVADEVLALRGGSVDGIVAVYRGYMKAQATADHGSTFLLDLLQEGDWIGAAPWLCGEPRHFDIVAMTEATVLLVNGALLSKTLERWPLAYRNLAMLVGERLLRLLNQHRMNALSDGPGRLACRLTEFVDRLGVAGPAGQVTIPFRLSQEEIAQLVGITRESAGRHLREWQRAGWIEPGYARLVIRDREALRRMAAGS